MKYVLSFIRQNFFLLLTILTALFFVCWYFPISLPHGQPTISHSIVPDAEVDFLVSLRTYQGKGLYSDFSVSYPPGRFFLQGLLFHIFTPSFVVLSVLHIAIVLVFFPAALLILTFLLFRIVLTEHLLVSQKKHIDLLAYGLALVSTVIYLTFIRSAQETHLLTAFFFITLLSTIKLGKMRKILLGFFFGLIFLFRIDSGVILALSLIAALTPSFIKKWRTHLKENIHLFIGFFLVWIPTVGAILINGSLLHFLYDTLILGLIIQPRFMSMPIPGNEFGLVYLAALIFIIASSASLFFDSIKVKNIAHRVGIQSFALLSALSYVAALGRSDEPHLWYGLVWLSPLIIYTVSRITVGVFKREKFSLPGMLIGVVSVFVYSWITIKIKAPIAFLISTTVVFLVLNYRRFTVFSFLIGGTIISLVVFHSLSYIKLRYSLPRPPSSQAPFAYDWITTEGAEVAGFQIVPETESVLKQIRADIPANEKYLYIFPKNLLLNEYFELENPTRYIMLTLERSDWTEREMIAQIEEKNTRYFLVFTKDATTRLGGTWDWILKNTQPVKTYMFGTEEAVLRIKK